MVQAIRLLVCGFLALAVSFGVRATFGFLFGPVGDALGTGVGWLSLTLAVQNLVWGAAQPFAGALADRRGAGIVAAGGGAIYALGLAVMATTASPAIFFVASGILVGVAQAAIGFPVVLAAVGRATAERHRTLFLGIATAGGSFGQLIFAPIGARLVDGLGYANALLVLALVCLGLIALAAGMRESAPAARPGAADGQRWGEALRAAMAHRGFLLLCAGFFVCGFQLAFIVFHLPLFAALCGLASGVAAAGIALIGLFNIVGTVVAGQLGGVFRPKFPLAAIYAVRSLAAVAMVSVPVTEGVLYAFSVAMGLLWLSTVPLTSAVVAQIFGPRHVGMLFGVVFFSHQVGSFLGVWLAGALYDLTGSYDAIWWLSAALGLMAALVNLPIDDRRAAPVAAPAR